VFGSADEAKNIKGHGFRSVALFYFLLPRHHGLGFSDQKTFKIRLKGTLEKYVQEARLRSSTARHEKNVKTNSFDVSISCSLVRRTDRARVLRPIRPEFRLLDNQQEKLS
jgi:hypothetical protein